MADHVKVLQQIKSGADYLPIMQGAYPFTYEQIEAALDAAIAALESPRLPKGWVAVPEFPTNEMVDASMIRVPIAKRIPAGATFKVLGARAWDAMIAAAPKLAGGSSE